MVGSIGETDPLGFQVLLVGRAALRPRWPLARLRVGVADDPRWLTVKGRTLQADLSVSGLALALEPCGQTCSAVEEGPDRVEHAVEVVVGHAAAAGQAVAVFEEPVGGSVDHGWRAYKGALLMHRLPGGA